MSDPTPVTRAVTYERDGHRYLSCGSRLNLQYQHRAAVCMGGRKIQPLLVEGVTSCANCNPQDEDVLQAEALRCGWKIRKCVSDAARVPVFYPLDKTWFMLTGEGMRIRITTAEAMSMMHDVYGTEYDDKKGLVP